MLLYTSTRVDLHILQSPRHTTCMQRGSAKNTYNTGTGQLRCGTLHHGLMPMQVRLRPHMLPRRPWHIHSESKETTDLQGQAEMAARTSGRLVAAMQMTGPASPEPLSKPSSSVSSWFSVCSRSSLPTLRSRVSRPATLSDLGL